ncbi:hypothetical protein [Verrucomicrobium spinosum]|uniref:hypothetical protein n=1 Tax=Verrucomicrobium spinosum TaxID=2736 RepID=UPI001C44FD37|nr:hypothetical protein [Verrucomicrobium spinosum]
MLKDVVGLVGEVPADKIELLEKWMGYVIRNKAMMTLSQTTFRVIGTETEKEYQIVWSPARGRSVVQEWPSKLPMMQQTVLLCALRGPDGLRKESPAKAVLRAYRRVILLSAMDGLVLADAYVPGGGSFTGPCSHPDRLQGAMRDFIRGVDEMPHHFLMHFIHAVEIVGYKHPDPLVAGEWGAFYTALCKGLHMNEETMEQLDHRLGDNRERWIETQQTPIGEIVQ